MKTYLVTGGAGFIGSNFIEYVLNKNKDIYVINLDKLTYAGNLQNLDRAKDKPNYKFIQMDVCDKEALDKVFKDNSIDYVVNFAAESHVDRSIEEPEVFIKTNVLGTVTLLNCAKKYWSKGDAFLEGKKFLQVSTDEVYGSLGSEGYFTEKTPLDAHSPYSSSKASADMIVKSYFDTFSMPINITRCSNNYGKYQFPEKLIPLIINNCINNKSIPVYGDGMNIRDWLYVEDHCKAIELVLRKGKIGEIYNIGGHNEKTNIHIVKAIINYINENTNYCVSEELIKYVTDRKGHDRRYAIDAEKIKNDLGWYPETEFSKGIVKTINWYIENEEWMKNVTSGDYKKYYEKMYKDR